MTTEGAYTVMKYVVKQ